MSLRLALALATAIAAVAMLIACSEKKADAPAGDASRAASASSSPAPAPTSTQVPYAAPGPATFSIIGGRNEGPLDIEQFMPYLVHIREGDAQAKPIAMKRIQFTKPKEPIAQAIVPAAR